MAKTKKNKLRVEAAGGRRYISVPAAEAHDLHQYLRNHRVHSAPPAPYYTGFDSIELAKGIDVASVQALLDAWG